MACLQGSGLPLSAFPLLCCGVQSQPEQSSVLTDGSFCNTRKPVQVEGLLGSLKQKLMAAFISAESSSQH
eukprot:1161643-Pelagomonas_calceolata.AAC.2